MLSIISNWTWQDQKLNVKLNKYSIKMIADRELISKEKEMIMLVQAKKQKSKTLIL